MDAEAQKNSANETKQPCITILVILALIGIVVFFVVRNNQNNKRKEILQAEQAAQATQAAMPTPTPLPTYTATVTFVYQKNVPDAWKSYIPDTDTVTMTRYEGEEWPILEIISRFDGPTQFYRMYAILPSEGSMIDDCSWSDVHNEEELNWWQLTNCPDIKSISIPVVVQPIYCDIEDGGKLFCASSTYNTLLMEVFDTALTFRIHASEVEKSHKEWLMEVISYEGFDREDLPRIIEPDIEYQIHKTP